MSQGITKFMEWIRLYWAIITTVFSVMGVCIYTLFSFYFSMTARADVDDLQNKQIESLKENQIAQDKELAVLKKSIENIEEDTEEIVTAIRSIQFKPL